MLSIKNLFSKNKNLSEDFCEEKVTLADDNLGKAMQIAAAVDESISKQDYTQLSSKLSVMKDSGEKEKYIFPYPSVTLNAILMLLYIALAFGTLYTFSIGCMTACLSTKYRIQGIALVVISLFMISFNIKAVCDCVRELKFKKRFETYENYLGYKNFEYIEELAQNAKYSENVVISDLQKAIKKKLIPQGHFTNKNIVFVVSDDSFQEYEQRAVAYDRYFEKKLEEKKKEKSRSTQINDILNRGNDFIHKVYGYAGLIKDKAVSKELIKMADVVALIFEEVDANPSCIGSLNVFLNYYLPATEKLLTAYLDLCEKKNAFSLRSKKEIEEAFGTLISAYEQILEKIYEDREMDITAEIETLESMLQEDGISG